MVKIAVVGSFVMDFIFETEKRPVKGESVVGRSFSMAPGGKGANQAMQAALLGADVKVVGRLGEEVFGQQIIDSLNGAGVDTGYVKRDPAGTACSGIVLDAEGDNSIVMVPRANMECRPADVDAAREVIEAADMLLLQLEIPMDVNERAVKIAKELGKKIIMDPAPARELDEFYYSNVDIMTPNETEAGYLSGVEVRDPASAREAAARLAGRGLGTVIITLGGAGTLLRDGGGEARLFPARKVDVKDTTAAGDSFTGALAVFLGEGKELGEAVRLAGLAASLSTTKLGAQPSLPDRKAFEAFCAETEG